MIPIFNDIDELSRFAEKEMKWDKRRMYAMKKSVCKHADPFAYRYEAPSKDVAVKEVGVSLENSSSNLLVKAIINTTNLMDSHDDVHFPGLWKKNLGESKFWYHCQEHEMTFKGIISDEVTAYTKTYAWSDLGESYEGNTQALKFDSIVSPTRNEFMHDQYKRGYVRNHSVSMYYVKILFCVNSKDKIWAEEKANWEIYRSGVANGKCADEKGMFWAVLEAKIREGSAVPAGSNWVTPTESVTEAKHEAAHSSTSNKIEPPAGTRDQIQIIKQIKF